jgi:phenylalanyl-tRNA synthetase beta chain
MNISLNLLRKIIDCDWSYEKIAEKLTLSGTEVEAIEHKGREISGVISAKVISKSPVQGSDKLSLCSVDTGNDRLQVVCGAPNVAVDQIVFFAPVNASLPNGVKLDKAKIHGLDSFGMILSEAELELTPEGDVIAVLPSDIKPGTPLEKIIDYKDTIFELEITPNRPDCLSHVGIARELQALGGGRVKMPDTSISEIAELAGGVVKIKIDDPDGCPRYTARVLRNVKIGQSPLWLKVIVSYLGMRPINNVVDITNYVMMETGQPLHAFDFDLFKKPEVVVKRATDGEKFTTLDNVVRTLNSKHLLITDGVEPVALAGIMGGLHSEVIPQTENVLLESAFFNPVVVRRGSKALGLTSESSRRFERGVDPELAPRANDRACKLISEICGGKILKGLIDIYPKQFVPVNIELRTARVERVLGAKITASETTQILSGLDIEFKSDNNIQVTQPSFRPDLVREADLIEEIARIYGFDKIPARFQPGGDLSATTTKFQRVREKIRSYLVGAGACEIFPITLSDSKLADKLGILEQSVRLINPLSEEMGIVRPNLLLTMLPVIRRNLSFREKNLTLFETGDVYYPGKDGQVPTQKAHLAIAISGAEFPDFWGMKWRPRDIYSLKGLLEDLADYLKVDRINLKPTTHFAFDIGYTFDVYCGEILIGQMGRLSTAACDAAEIKETAFIAELDLDKLVELTTEVINARELARFPSADRDIAILVDESLPAAEIQAEITKAGGEMVEETWIFDLYKGKGIPQGKRSLAFGIKYRLADRTLTDEEVNQAQNRIISALENKFKAELRK